MTEVRVFTRVPFNKLEFILQGWLDRENPVEVLAVSQSQINADDLNIVIFYEKLTDKFESLLAVDVAKF